MAKEILEEMIDNASKEDWIEVTDLQETLRKIFKAVGKKEKEDSEESTDEEEIIAEFVAHRKCNVRCRVRYLPIKNANISVESEEDKEENCEEEIKDDSEEEEKEKKEKTMFSMKPENMEELKEVLKYITENHKNFDLSMVDKLKEIFLNWTDDDKDVTEEEFEMYKDFMEARNMIRGTSDTESEDDEDSEEN